jgi:hypothetical protein
MAAAKKIESEAGEFKGTAHQRNNNQTLLEQIL